MRNILMTIEIHRPELEALIRGRMNSGGFQNAEDVVLQAFRSGPAARSVRFPLLVDLAAVCNACDADKFRRVIDYVYHALVTDANAPLIFVAF